MRIMDRHAAIAVVVSLLVGSESKRWDLSLDSPTHSAPGDRHGGNYRSPIGSISCDAAFCLYHSANDERIIVVVLGVIHGNDLQNCLPSVLGFHDSKVHM